jgi:hypothetical protein
MDEGPTDQDKGNDKGKLITFPGGKKVDPKEVGLENVVGQTGDIPTSEILDPVNIDQEIRKRTEFVNKEKLTQTIAEKRSTIDTIDVVLGEVAEELGHLKYERRKAAKEGKNTASYTIGRINSLTRLADLLLKKKESMMQEELDLKSSRFQAVFKVWIEFFHNSMEKSGVSPEIIDIVFQQMKADMVDWERKMSTAGIE